MGKQLIISVGREFGSGGHVIAKLLADHYALPLYDRNILDEVSKAKNVSAEELHQYDEVPKSRLLTRSVRGFTNSIEENVAQLQFKYLKYIASEGRSFVVLGRCAETVLKGNKGLVSVFVLGDRESKIQRTMECEKLTRSEAESKLDRHDKSRKVYHNSHSDGKWGDSRSYDLCINSSRLGIEETAAVIIDFIDRKIKADNS